VADELDIEPLSFALLGALTETLCGMLVPCELALMVELQRILGDAAAARMDGARLTPESIPEAVLESRNTAAAVLNAALVSAGAEWALLVPYPVDLTARPEPSRRLD
jgi:hypothetical protein